jgi:hypothetical protein
MEAAQISASRYAEIYRDTLDVIQTINKVTERINRPDSLVTDSEASQSLDCLRADISRISGDLEDLHATTSTEHDGASQASEAWSTPVILGGLALGFFLEKPWGNDFSTAP